MIAQGKLDNEIRVRGGSRSETAELLSALEVMQSAIAEQIHRIEHLREEDAKRQQAFQQQVSQAVRSMAETVEREMTLAVDAVEQDTRRMAGVAGTLQQTSANLGTSAESVSGLARNSLTTAQTVASAAEELTASFQDIGRQVESCAAVTREAVESANAAQEVVRSLAGSFLTAWLAFWWPLLVPGRLAPAGRLIYVSAAFFLAAPVAVLIMLAQHTVYPYYDTTPHLFGWPEWSADRPNAGVAIGAGEPLCTVHADAATAADAKALLDERMAAIHAWMQDLDKRVGDA